LVVAEKVSYRYSDNTLALSDVSFRVKRGEFVSILGANGAGKSTLLKTMVGLTHSYEGSLSLADIKVRPSNFRKLYKKVGYVFQNSDDQLFMPTVYDDVAYGPKNLGISDVDIKELISDSLESVGMKGFEKKAIYTLSAGQKKRIALACVLAMKPDVMLLDEPVAGLDPVGVHQIMELLKKLNNTTNLTVIMATHNINLLPVFMDRVVVMDKGCVISYGIPQTVFNDKELQKKTNLKLPEIAQLMRELKEEHNLPWKSTPLTISEAKEVLRNPIKSYYT